MKIFGATVEEYAIFAAWTLGGLLMGWLIERFVAGRIRALARKSEWPGWSVVADGLGHMPMFWLALGGAMIALDGLAWSGRAEEYITRAVIVLAGLTVTVAAARIATGLVKRFAQTTDGPVPSTTIFVNITRIAVVLLGGLLILNALNISIMPILTALGVGGLAVALALQDTLSNLFAGVQVIASKQIRVGDFVEIDAERMGYVEDINWRYTAIRMLSDNRIVIPNAKLASSIITNYDLPDQPMSVLVQLGVAYDSDLEQVERVTCEVAAEVVADVAPAVVDYQPMVRFHTFGDSSIDFTVILRTDQFVDQYVLKHEFVKRLKKRYDAEGIEIPFPQRVVHKPGE